MYKEWTKGGLRKEHEWTIRDWEIVLEIYNKEAERKKVWAKRRKSRLRERRSGWIV